MEQRKWFDRSQPQTLQSACLLSYLNAALAIFYALVAFGTSTSLLVILLGAAIGAIGIANEKKWGYWLCVACAFLYLLSWVSLIAVYHIFTFGIVINLLFAVVLVVLLLHPQSREYRKIWFH